MYVRRDGSKFLRPLNVLAFLIVLPQLCSTSHDDLLFNNTAVYRVEFVLDQQDIHAVFIDLRLLTGSFQLKARHDNYWYSKNHCPRRPVSIWQKHRYVCLFLPADDLTICMDILPNPGPVSPISSPRNDSVYKLGGKICILGRIIFNTQGPLFLNFVRVGTTFRIWAGILSQT